jgi:adenylate cyclase
MFENPTAGTAWLESPSGEKTFLRDSCQIGRGANSQIILPSEKVSRRHAVIHAQANEFCLIDLGSANGTYLNGRRVSQPSRLTDKDMITIGDYSFRFFHPEQTAAVEGDTANKTIQEIRNLNLWLLLADVEAATQITKRVPADEAPRIIGSWLNSCKQVIDDNGGTINKFLGDGFFAYWLDNEEAAPLVAKALLAFKQTQEKADPRFRVVVHFGKVFVGGAANMGEESLMGNEVNFIFRVEKLAGSLGVQRLLSEAASKQIGSHLPNASHGRHAVTSFEGDFGFFTF